MLSCLSLSSSLPQHLMESNRGDDAFQCFTSCMRVFDTRISHQATSGTSPIILSESSAAVYVQASAGVVTAAL